MLPRLYLKIYSSEKGRQFFQEKWILALTKSVKTFVMVLISEMPNIKYYQKFGNIYG